MRRIAIYGKGGIGKSTTSANVSAALAEKGMKVMQIGCDPKSDSTKLLVHNKRTPTVLDRMRAGGDITLDDLVHEGYKGVMCVECGGPRPGMGCAGRGIIAAFETLERLKVIDRYDPDVIIYDVLGDVVCGGFALPIRNGYAKDVFIVTSGEMMALYAASNISEAINNFSSNGYASLGGLIQNSRGVVSEDDLVDAAAKEMGTKIVARIRRDPSVQRCESDVKTVIEGEPESEQAQAYRSLAESLIALSVDVDGGMKLV